MTVKEIQELVDAWNEKHSIRTGDLAGIAGLTEKIGALASAVAVRHPGAMREDGTHPLADEVAALFWELASFSTQAGIDLTDAVIDHLEKKNHTK